MKAALSSVAGAGVVIAVMSLQASGQPARPAATLDDVLNELRTLRTDLSQSTNVSVRGQLLTARLSLQEQRINVLGQELAEAQAQLDTAAKDRSSAELQVQQMETAFAVFSRDASQGDLPKQVEAQAAQTRKALQDAQAREQRIRAQATDIANLIATEQGRWTDFNNRLDELERSLPPAR